MIDSDKKSIIKQALVAYLKENYVPKRRSYRTSDSYMSEACRCNSCIFDEEDRRYRKIDELLDHMNDTFQETMFYHIDSKHLDEVEVYKKACIDRKLFSKIRSNKDYKPNKKTAICICFGLKLNIDEALDLLEKAGYTLSKSSKFDMIVRYFFETEEYDIEMLNSILYDYKLSLLTNYE